MQNSTSWNGGRRGFPTATRALILHRDPTCRCTGCRIHTGPCTRPSTIADHIRNVAEGGTDDPRNGQGMCSPCHDRKTAAEIVRGRARHSRRRPAPKHPGLSS